MSSSKITLKPEVGSFRKSLIGAPQRVLWRTPSQSIDAARLLGLMGVAVDDLRKIARKRVAVVPGCSLDTAAHLTAASGVASDLLLLPSEGGADLWRRLCVEMDIQIVLTPSLKDPFYPEAEQLEYFMHVQGDEVADTTPSAFEAASEIETNWVLSTSGTTGVPKLVRHTLETLTRSLKSNPLEGKKYTWGLVYDLHRFAGMQVFLQAFFGGSTLAFPGSRNNYERIVVDLRDCQCNALSATPSLWRKLMMCEGVEELPLRLITLGGEVADGAILKLLRARFPAARLTHIYASTEAGVGFSVHDGLPGFPKHYLHEPPQGNIRIAVNEEGILLIQPRGAIPDMAGSQHLTSFQGETWINTGDLVELIENRYHFLGRSNGTINVGGAKVHPEKVEAVVLQVDGVSMAMAWARRNSILGQVVEVVVQPAEGVCLDTVREDIEVACQCKLAEYERPVCVRFEENIELTSAGKQVVFRDE